MKNFLKKFFGNEAVRFLMVGVINTLVGTGIMFLLLNLTETPYWICVAANYITGGIVSYFLNKYFTFRNNEKSFKQVLLFVAVMVVCVVLAHGIAKPLVFRLLAGKSEALQKNISALAGTVLYTVLNFIGQKFLAFKKKEDK